MNERILIIDDSPDDLALLVRLLKKSGYQLSISQEGHNGYQRACVNPPELILLDVYMPKMDGYAVCRLLKSDPRTKSIPIIFLTAAADIDSRLKGFSLGAIDFISKPYFSDEVAARIRVHLNYADRFRGITQVVAPPIVDTASSTSPECVDHEDVLLQLAKRLLIDHMNESISSTELLNKLGCNSRVLNTKFNLSEGMTPFEWQRQERLRRARKLLSETNLDISIIAEELGYHSQSHFSNNFNKNHGISPREFRNINKLLSDPLAS
jgi:DNA-binding response OmpR family regulator